MIRYSDFYPSTILVCKKIRRVDFYSLSAAMVFVTGWLFWSDAVKNEMPATTWLEVRSISVPNFVEGEDPFVVYDRVIHKSFNGTWHITVHRAGEVSGSFYCSGNETKTYDQNEKLPKTGVLLSWFIGKDCALSEGQYTLQENWEIKPDGYPVKHETYASNLFRVLPKGSQLYLTPEQTGKVNGLPTP